MSDVLCQLTWFPRKKITIITYLLNISLNKKCADSDVIMPDLLVIKFFFYFPLIRSHRTGNFLSLSEPMEFSKAPGP